MKKMTGTMLSAFILCSLNLSAQETPVAPAAVAKQPELIQLEPTVYHRTQTQQIDNPPLEIEGEQRALPWKEKNIPVTKEIRFETEKEQISLEYSIAKIGHSNSEVKSDLIINDAYAFKIKSNDTRVQATPMDFVFDMTIVTGG